MDQGELREAGLYFTCKCRSSECAQRGKSVLLYIGVGQEFKFEETWHATKCARCGEVFSSVTSVGFFRCRWTYRGVVENGSRYYEPDHFAYGFIECRGPLRYRWRTLSLGAYKFTLEEMQATQNYVLGALEGPPVSAPAKRTCEQSENTPAAGEMQEGSCQTLERSLPREEVQKLLLDLSVSERVLKCVRKEVMRKEQTHEELRRSLQQLEDEVASL